MSEQKSQFRYVSGPVDFNDEEGDEAGNEAGWGKDAKEKYTAVLNRLLHNEYQRGFSDGTNFGRAHVEMGQALGDPPGQPQVNLAPKVSEVTYLRGLVDQMEQERHKRYRLENVNMYLNRARGMLEAGGDRDMIFGELIIAIAGMLDLHN